MIDCPKCPASLSQSYFRRREGSGCRSSDAAVLLLESVHLVGPTVERSNRAALEAATRICAGDLWNTLSFLNKILPSLDVKTPHEPAEQSEEGLDFVIDMIGAIKTGVYL